MFRRTITLLAAVVCAAATLPVLAGDVEITGVHICCNSCVKGVEAALKGVEGVTNVNADRKSKSIKFTAADDKAAEAGIQALATGGFHGTAKHGDKGLDFPASGAKADAKSADVKIEHVHMCCGACVKAVDAAVKKVAGVGKVTADQEQSSIEVTGENVSIAAVVKALNDAGFHATVKE